MASTYKTEGKTRLITFFSQHPDEQYTVEELHAALLEAYPQGETGKGGGKSSLYRQLSGLIEEGTVRKFRDDTQSAYVYQYVGGGACACHFHLKCLNCGRLEHLDCIISDQLLSHIRTDHHFDIDRGRSSLYGMCRVCHSSVEDSRPVELPLCEHAHRDEHERKEI